MAKIRPQRRRPAIRLAIAGLAWVACGSPQRTALEHANVLLVVVDALRADRLGCYGADRPTSPFLDQLAERSVLFESATSTSSQTVPATLSLLTASYPHRHGNQFYPKTQSFRSPRRRVRPEVPGDLETLAERLAADGFRTGAVVANPWLDPRYGFDRGFERYAHLPADPGRKGEARAPVLNQAAREILASFGDERFFLYVHYMDVHSPYEPPEPHRAAFVPAEGRLIYRNGAHPEMTAVNLAKSRALYDAEVRSLDDGIRELFEILRVLGLEASTLVVFTADHGDEFAEHGGLGHGVTLYEEVLQVPLFFFHPALQGRAGRIQTPVSGVDVFPTLLELVGLPPSPGLDGVSLVPWIRGERGLVSDRALLAELGGLKAVRRGSLKRIRGSGPDGFDRAFDLARDPREERPLGDADAERAVSSTLLDSLFPDSGELLAKPAARSSEEERLQRQLEALGYVE